MNMENTYWNNLGTHQALVEKLNLLIPAQGEIKGSKNRNLDRFRKASNAYYDIFNNGGMNRGRAISSFFSSDVIFHLRQTHRTRGYFNADMERNMWNRIHNIVEPKMDAIVLAAAREQNLI